MSTILGSHNDIPFCVGFRLEHWMGLDVVPLSKLGVLIADDICKNSDPHEYVDANALVSTMWACAF